MWGKMDLSKDDVEKEKDGSHRIMFKTFLSSVSEQSSSSSSSRSLWLNSFLFKDERIVISRDVLSALINNEEKNISRTIVLQRGQKGFGFVLRGSRGKSSFHLPRLLQFVKRSLVAGQLFQPNPSFPALQFLDSIEKNSNADKAGLKQNDYVLEVRSLFSLFSFLFWSLMFLFRSMEWMWYRCLMKNVFNWFNCRERLWRWKWSQRRVVHWTLLSLYPTDAKVRLVSLPVFRHRCLWIDF